MAWHRWRGRHGQVGLVGPLRDHHHGLGHPCGRRVTAPFEAGGDPLPGWYRAATERIKSVRFVFSDTEAGPAQEVLSRHLEHNILGDRFTERSFVTEPVTHGGLAEPAFVDRYIESVVAELKAGR